MEVSFCVRLLSEPHGTTVEPSSAYSEQDLLAAFRSALPAGDDHVTLGALAVRGIVGADGLPALRCTARAADVRGMHALRSRVLSGDLDAALARALGGVPRADAGVGAAAAAARLMPRADCSQFAAQLEESVLALDELTPHQALLAIFLFSFSFLFSLAPAPGGARRRVSGRGGVKVCARSNTLQRDALAMVEEDEKDEDGDGEAAAHGRDGGGGTVAADDDVVTPRDVCCVGADDDGADAARSATAVRAAPTHVHLRAPAGAGKTFVALHRALAVLTRPIAAGASADTRTGVNEGDGGRVLFVARNEALGLFAASWLARRAPRGAARRRLLSRLDVLCEPFGHGPRRVALRGARRVALRPPRGDGGGGEDGTTAAAARGSSVASSSVYALVTRRTTSTRARRRARRSRRASRRASRGECYSRTFRRRRCAPRVAAAAAAVAKGAPKRTAQATTRHVAAATAVTTGTTLTIRTRPG